MKTSALIGPALDWAVAKCEGKTLVFFDEYFIRNGIASGKSQGRVNSMLDFQPLKGKWCRLNSLGGGVAIYDYSTNWSQGGPIIERESIDLMKVGVTQWRADCGPAVTGPTPLIAAMRAFVTKKFGVEIEIPEELQ